MQVKPIASSPRATNPVLISCGTLSSVILVWQNIIILFQTFPMDQYKITCCRDESLKIYSIFRPGTRRAGLFRWNSSRFPNVFPTCVLWHFECWSKFHEKTVLKLKNRQIFHQNLKICVTRLVARFPSLTVDSELAPTRICCRSKKLLSQLTQL